MKYKHVIFDLDGTLIDTQEAILQTWQFTLKEYQYDYSLEELKVVLGITAHKALEILHVAVNENFEDRWSKNYRTIADKMTFFDGVKEMLISLRQRGYSLGIITSRSRKEYNDFFRTFTLEALFDLILCADDTRKHKPDPEPIYKYAELSKVGLGLCLYIGDMPTDIECANRAGIASGLVTWNNSGISCQDATYIFTSPEQIKKVV